MLKKIKPWASSGDKEQFTPDHDAKVALGWIQDDEPGAENWNYIQGERDDAINEIAENEIAALKGIYPGNLDGGGSRGYPVFRPNTFSGIENLWWGGSARNKVTSPSSGEISDVAFGWDPAWKMPVMVFSHYASAVSDTNTLSLTFIKCWDYEESPVYSEERVLTFPFNMRRLTVEQPILICDGYLYVVMARYADYYRFIYRFDLANWSGLPDASLALGSLWPGRASEMVELADDEIGFFASRDSDLTFRIYRIKKDLSSYATTSTPLAGAGAPANRGCRTDGDWMFMGGFDPLSYPQIIYGSATGSQLYKLNGGASMAGSAFVDFFPSSTGSEAPFSHPVVSALVQKDSTTTDAYVVTLGTMAAFQMAGAPTFDVPEAEPQYSKAGCFCAHGAHGFLVLNRTTGSVGSHGVLSRFNPDGLLSSGYSSLLFPADGRNGMPFSGSISGTYHEKYIRTRAYHDGRAVWIVDLTAGIARRVVAPEASAL